MNFKHTTILFILLALFVAQTSQAQLSVIPLPAQTEINEGVFSLNAETKLSYDSPLLLKMATEAAQRWQQNGLTIKPEAYQNGSIEGVILLSLNRPNDKQLGLEGYSLTINKNAVVLRANTDAGIRYGLQTIGQLLDVSPNGQLPCVTIVDYPRFAYRGMHLDVVRHFMPLSLVYKLLDQLEKHKMNVFHWHLTDDQGWRIEIKKYPKLTEIGGYRVPMDSLHWNSMPLIADRTHATYGGFYTQDEIREVVAYAAERNITVVPEIEMPAHVMALLAAYPELACTGDNLGVAPGGVWPITHILCAGKEETYHFMEDVLTEVMDIFPSTFIHIGGDEADKTNWMKCQLCQQKMQEHGLKNEHELQSHFIQRIEKFVNAHGRRIIGWDEILEGGLAPNATVMSWRGETGGIEAAKMGHQVIMSPGTHCYLDHYQGDPAIEPLAIGGFTPLSKVYSFEPVPAALTAEQAQYIIGAQGNHWSEYISTPSHLEYMAFPRLAALSEVLWSPKSLRNWDGFAARLPQQMKRYERDGINASRSAYQVRTKAIPSSNPNAIEVGLETEMPGLKIHYTMDGSEPNLKSPLYVDKVVFERTGTLKAATFEDGKKVSANMERDFYLHKAFKKELHINNLPNKQYNHGGIATLVDGIKGTTNHNDQKWLGFLGDDLQATLDLGAVTKVQSVSVDALKKDGDWIFAPKHVKFEVSTDGVAYTEIENIETKKEESKKSSGMSIMVYEAQFESRNIRYVRVTVTSLGVCPPDHQGAGEKGWLFVSEIMVD
jgi:hexosaminidase